MLEFDRIDISEGVEINKTNASKQCDICHYWYSLSKHFNYVPYICNGYHNLIQTAMNFNDADIVSAKGIDYRIHFLYLSKDDETNITNNSNLNENSGLL